jgi:hypothetical protein
LKAWQLPVTVANCIFGAGNTQLLVAMALFVLDSPHTSARRRIRADASHVR